MKRIFTKENIGRLTTADDLLDDGTENNSDLIKRSRQYEQPNFPRMEDAGIISGLEATVEDEPTIETLRKSPSGRISIWIAILLIALVAYVAFSPDDVDEVIAGQSIGCVDVHIPQGRTGPSQPAYVCQVDLQLGKRIRAVSFYPVLGNVRIRRMRDKFTHHETYLIL